MIKKIQLNTENGYSIKTRSKDTIEEKTKWFAVLIVDSQQRTRPRIASTQNPKKLLRDINTQTDFFELNNSNNGELDLGLSQSDTIILGNYNELYTGNTPPNEEIRPNTKDSFLKKRSNDSDVESINNESSLKKSKKQQQSKSEKNLKQENDFAEMTSVDFKSIKQSQSEIIFKNLFCFNIDMYNKLVEKQSKLYKRDLLRRSKNTVLQTTSSSFSSSSSSSLSATSTSSLSSSLQHEKNISIKSKTELSKSDPIMNFKNNDIDQNNDLEKQQHEKNEESQPTTITITTLDRNIEETQDFGAFNSIKELNQKGRYGIGQIHGHFNSKSEVHHFIRIWYDTFLFSYLFVL